MILRIGWLTPFDNRSGVGTFSRAITDALPEAYDGREIDLTIITRLTDGLYPSRHRIIDIGSVAPSSRFYDLFDMLVFNIGNNEEHHKQIFDVLRKHPGVVICHDYVYQHVLAKMVYDAGSGFADYVALAARYGSVDALRRIRQSNITRSAGLRYALWDSDLSADMPLGAPLFQLGSALVVHSCYAAAYAESCFEGPVLRLAMPHDQRSAAADTASRPPSERRQVIVSFGHVQNTKCIHDVLLAIAGSTRLRECITYVISGFASDGNYLTRLRNLIDEHDLGDCVRFALDLKDAALETLRREADAFVNLRFPNTEGASVSLIEQLLTGRPVIVFDTGCYAEVPDGAVIKVARPRDIDAITAAMHRLFEPRESLDEIGALGRAHAMRMDCYSYALGLLAFIAREEALLRRRSGASAERLLGEGGLEAAQDEHDAPWARRLATARETLDLVEQGRLAEDPVLIESLTPEQLAEFTQAAILRCGTNLRLSQALRAYYADGRDVVRRSRILHTVQAIVTSRDESAVCVLPDIVPHGDMSFWGVIAALGDDLLALVAHGACFGDLAAEASDPARSAESTSIRRLRLAGDLERRGERGCRVDHAEVVDLVEWLRRTVPPETEITLDPLPVGRTIDIGSSDQRRFLEMAGFYTVHDDHVWSKPDTALLYVSPAPDATKLALQGNTMPDNDLVTVAITIRTRVGMRKASQSISGGRKVFEISISDDVDLAPGRILCIEIHSTNCRSPLETGRSEDFRPLGFQLHNVTAY